MDIKDRLNIYQNVYINNFLHSCLYKGPINEDFTNFDIKGPTYEPLLKILEAKRSILKFLFDEIRTDDQYQNLEELRKTN
jgi:hypothetical protein